MPSAAVTEREAAVRVPLIRAPVLVGREHELAALADALSGGPAVVLVEGEAGIGKSRLVQEYLASPAGRPRRSLMASCPPYRRPLTLGPVVDGVRQAVDDVTGLRLSGLAGALRPLFPEWAQALPAAPEQLEDASAARHRLFRALAELLGLLGVTTLVAEDAHWADEATLEFLLFLAARQPQDVSLVVTYRPEDVPESSLLRRLSSRLPAGTTRERITLAPLDAARTAELVASMLPGGQVSAAFAGFLCAHTDGLPLAIEESVRLLRDRRDLRRQGGEWVRRHLGELAVPPTVRDAVLERAGRLGADARMALRAACVLADPSAELALSAVSGLTPERNRAGLAEAISCGLLTEDGRGLVSFRHVLASRAVYEAISVPERREMHLRAGLALEGMAPPPVAQLARHFREAGEAGIWCRYAEQAADLALAAADDKMALTFLHDLLTHAELPTDSIVRLTRKIPLSALDGNGALQEFARVLRLVFSRPGLTSAQRAQVGSRLGWLLVTTGDFPSGVAELERAIPGLACDPVEAAKAMVVLAWPNRSLRPAAVDRRWLDRAATTMTGLGVCAGDRLPFDLNRATALLQMGAEDGWVVIASLPGDAANSREARRLGRAYLNGGDAALQWGRYEDARRLLASALQLTHQDDCTRVRDIAHATLVHLDWFTGAWTSLAERAMTLAAEHDLEPVIRMETTLVAGLLDLAMGAHAAGERKLRDTLDEGRRRGVLDMPLEPAAALARLCLAGGCIGDALELTDEPMQVITRKGIWLWATDVAPARVQALVLAGREEEAAKLTGAFGRGLRGRDMPAPAASLATCRAIVARGRGDHGRAAGLFGRAAAAWQALPRPYDALLAQEAQAGCLLAAGAGEAGVGLLFESFTGFSDLGATGDANRVAQLLREHGVEVRRAHPGGRPGYGDRLSPRELEVVELVAAGQTNREIARALVLSPKTVARHVDSAMRKLKVPSRTALAVGAIETGIIPGAPSGEHRGWPGYARAFR